ncbi:SCO family protein [Sphingoaurantiacus capsulatus]|uniref:SCO family protein n=1 Tax=Sphingoaurantiacus capsulatus TaxID=1771310 RepID=A0ABV7XGN9_9SPHN
MNSPAPSRRIPFALLAGVLLILCAAAGALLYRAQSGGSGETPPLAGADIGGPFALVDGDGAAVTEKSYPGQWKLIYFGYTFCPDICPTDMQQLAQGLRQFEKADATRAAKVQPLFVTIDPARDTGPVVKTFTAAFHPRFIGLTGTQPQIDAALKTFRVYASKGAGTADAYLMDHSAIAYIFDPAGKPISFLPQGSSPEAVAAELAKWVR